MNLVFCACAPASTTGYSPASFGGVGVRVGGGVNRMGDVAAAAAAAMHPAAQHLQGGAGSALRPAYPGQHMRNANYNNPQ